MSFNEFINIRRKELGMSIDELVIKSGVPKGTLSKITAGINTNPTLSTVETLCKALNCTLNDAVGYVEENQATPNEMVQIKKYRILDKYGKKAIDDLLETEYERCTTLQAETEQTMTFHRFSVHKASAGCGYDLNDPDEWQDLCVIDTPEARQADFAVEVEGASMEPTYQDGDIVYIVTDTEVPIGKIGLFIQNGKGYIKEAGTDYLISHNADFPDIYPKEGEIISIGRVIGKAKLPD